MPAQDHDVHMPAQAELVPSSRLPDHVPKTGAATAMHVSATAATTAQMHVPSTAAEAGLHVPTTDQDHDLQAQSMSAPRLSVAVSEEQRQRVHVVDHDDHYLEPHLGSIVLEPSG